MAVVDELKDMEKDNDDHAVEPSIKVYRCQYQVEG